MPLIGWDFFLARFDTLAVEAQLNMAQMSGDVQITQGRWTYHVVDLNNSILAHNKMLL
jgi:hypothetical protein